MINRDPEGRRIDRMSVRENNSIYESDTGTLFVPTEDMWSVHEAAKPSTIAVRAGFRDDTLGRWQRAHGTTLVDWLLRRGEQPSGIQPTEAMLAFRKESSLLAITQAARRPSRLPLDGRKRGGRSYLGHVSVRLVNSWREKYRDVAWFEDWLLRGGPAPAEITIATRGVISKCRTAWDYVEHCRKSDTAAGNCYVTQWLGRRIIPSVDWLKWLYGGPVPDGFLVVDEDLERLKKEKTREAIFAAAGVRVTPRLFEFVKATAAGEKQKDLMRRVPADDHGSVHALLKAASIYACCDRAGVHRQVYFMALRHAEQLGIKDDLLAYLEPRKQGARQTGLLSEHLFLPSANMRAFRRIAGEAMAKEKVWSLSNMPAFDSWFVDWTMPTARHGRKHLARFMSHTGPEINGSKQQPRGGKAMRGAESGNPRHVRPASPPAVNGRNDPLNNAHPVHDHCTHEILERIAANIKHLVDAAATTAANTSGLPPVSDILKSLTASRTRVAVVGRSVFLDGAQVQIDATPEKLDDMLAFLHELIDAKGEWRSSTEIGAVTKNPDVRYDRVYAALPELIKKAIESSRRKGYRLQLLPVA